MTRLAALRRDQRGAAVVETALALPVFVLFVWGMFQVALALHASAGMQHALGEGARYATIWPSPTTAQIKQRISDKVFGSKAGTFTVANPTAGTDYLDLQVTYTMPMNFLFFSAGNLSLTRTKRVYVAQDIAPAT